MEIKIDMREVAALAEQMRVFEDQIPYAVSRALNTAIFETREKLVDETWPQHVTQRRPNFPSVVLHVDTSDKTNLTAAIRETSNTAPSLTLHAEGGTKTPRSASRFAIPLKGWAVRTASGVRSDQTVRALMRSTPKRALRITTKGIFVGEGGRLHLRYSFKPSAEQPADVPFYADFESNMHARVFDLLPAFLKIAMATRRPHK